MLVVHHTQSSVQENWRSERPGHQQINVKEFHGEEITFFAV
jgi:hypothetical protein